MTISKIREQQLIEYKYEVRKTGVLILAESFTTSMTLDKALDPETSLSSSGIGDNTTTYLAYSGED